MHSVKQPSFLPFKASGEVIQELKSLHDELIKAFKVFPLLLVLFNSTF